jgi:hypothetical protein
MTFLHASAELTIIHSNLCRRALPSRVVHRSLSSLHITVALPRDLDCTTDGLVKDVASVRETTFVLLTIVACSLWIAGSRSKEPHGQGEVCAERCIWTK